nr:MAG TPA: hypothetical protein [Caudoviricetes sp.]
MYVKKIVDSTADYSRVEKIKSLLGKKDLYFGYFRDAASKDDHLVVAMDGVISVYKFNYDQRCSLFDSMNKNFTAITSDNYTKNVNKVAGDLIRASREELTYIDLPSDPEEKVSEFFTKISYNYPLYGLNLIRDVLKQKLQEGPKHAVIFSGKSTEEFLDSFITSKMYRGNFLPNGEFTPALKTYFRVEDIIFLTGTKEDKIILPVTTMFESIDLLATLANFIVESLMTFDVIELLKAADV